MIGPESHGPLDFIDRRFTGQVAVVDICQCQTRVIRISLGSPRPTRCARRAAIEQEAPGAGADQHQCHRGDEDDHRLSAMDEADQVIEQRLEVTLVDDAPRAVRQRLDPAHPGGASGNTSLPPAFCQMSPTNCTRLCAASVSVAGIAPTAADHRQGLARPATRAGLAGRRVRVAIRTEARIG